MIKAALILDGNSITKWQKNALDMASDQLDIRLVLSCKNTSAKRDYISHFFYYVLNFFTLKNQLTNRIQLDISHLKTIEFESIYEGNWQKIPRSVSDELRKLDIDVIIKFGMSLLRIDKGLDAYKILSFHHGDPDYFRGRPAGFYELLFNKGSVGTIVQELSNTLDAGKVWAICHSKIYHHSYKKTAINFYSNSKYLLRKALINLQRDTSIETLSNGKNYRLPNNMLVIKFMTILLFRKLRRLLYGAFFEKKWNIATYRNCDMLKSTILPIRKAKSAIIGAKYSFYADPFFSIKGDVIRIEALNKINGLGEIIEIDAETLEEKTVLLKGNHYSYPHSFCINTEECLMPEVASHAPPYFLKLTSNSQVKQVLKGLEPYRVVDGTIVEKENIFYFFYSLKSNASDCLYVFYSKGLDQEFISHPLNPVVIDPSRGRMGGKIVHQNGKYFRYGQNNSYGYGNGISICEITTLSPTDFKEKVIGSLSFDKVKGPHTIDTFKEKSVVDFYVDQFSLFAWYRRIAPILLRWVKSSHSPPPATT